jgi:predicted CXXCH cytochrome family protein
MRCFLAALGLAVCLGCSRSPRAPAEVAPSLRLAVITDLKGYLEPCGCTSNPLGGIDRLAAQIEALRKDEVPLLVLLVGDVFFDEAELDPARVDQATRNAETLTRILNRIGVTAALVGRRDRAQPKALRTSLREQSAFRWLAPERETEVMQHRAGNLHVALIGAQPDASADRVAEAAAAATAKSDLGIVLMSGSRRDASRLGAIDGVDFVAQGGLDRDAPIPPRQAGDAWVLHAGRQGQGLTVVDVFCRNKDASFEDRSDWSREERAAQLDRQVEELAAKIEAWDESGEFGDAELEPQRSRLADLREQRAALDASRIESDGNAFFARWVELPKNAPRDRAVRKLMREHDRAVNEANRIAFANLKPPPLGPEDVAYVGSVACSSCHQAAFAWWRNHAHGAAYLTLQQRQKEFNLDCVGCHVTGYEEPGGSTVTHNLDMALVGVGCESCHGPGAAHSKDPEVAVVRNTPESICVECHNEEHSDLFDYDVYVKTLVVPGHGLPIKTRGTTVEN